MLMLNAPVEKSCNCCDVITCYFFCCFKKSKTPVNRVDTTVNQVAVEVIEEKQRGIE